MRAEGAAIALFHLLHGAHQLPEHIGVEREKHQIDGQRQRHGGQGIVQIDRTERLEQERQQIHGKQHAGSGLHLCKPLVFLPHPARAEQHQQPADKVRQNVDGKPVEGQIEVEKIQQQAPENQFHIFPTFLLPVYQKPARPAIADHAGFSCGVLCYLYRSGLSIIWMGRNWPVPRERLSASAATQAA